MDNNRVIELLEYIKAFDNLDFGATGIALDRAIASIKNLEKIKEILRKRDNAFDGQEFGASYSDLDNIIEEIREVIVKV